MGGNKNFNRRKRERMVQIQFIRECNLISTNFPFDKRAPANTPYPRAVAAHRSDAISKTRGEGLSRGYICATGRYIDCWRVARILLEGDGLPI